MVGRSVVRTAEEPSRNREKRWGPFSCHVSRLEEGGGGGGGGGAAAKLFFLFRPEQALPSLPSLLSARPLSRPFAPSPLDHSAEKKKFSLKKGEWRKETLLLLFSAVRLISSLPPFRLANLERKT